MPEKSTPFWAPVYAIIGRIPPIVLVKCWKVVHWNAKKLLPKFQKLPPKFCDVDPDPGRDPASYWRPVITFEFP